MLMHRFSAVGMGAGVLGMFCLIGGASALAAAPEKPVTEKATAVTATTATLNGKPTPLKEATVGYDFTYNTNGTCEPGLATEPIGEAPIAAAAKVSAEVTGLEPSQKYTFCLNASNPGGSTAGNVEAFKTLAAPPAIDSESSPSVNGTAATLSAQVNPNNQITKYTFEYSTQATGETLEGTITKVSGLAPLSGFGDQTAETRVEGLQPVTSYFWRVVAKNASSETMVGKVESFTTPLPPEKPLIGPVVLEGLTAKLSGTLNPNNAPEVNSSYEFLYRLSATECEGESSTGPVAQGGVQGEQVTAEATLQPNETYSFCLLARNQVGETVHSSVETLATPPSPPAIDAESNSPPTSTATTLSGQVNPNNQSTSYTFEYSTQATGETLEGAIVKVPGAVALTGFGDQPVEARLESLAPRTQYFWRIATINATSEAMNGKVEAFTTLDGPLVTTGVVQAVTRTTAAISGTVSPGGLSTRYHFVYVECPVGQSCTYGEGAKATPSEVLAATDYGTYPVGPQGLEELKPGTSYEYALVASNSEGERVGANQTFTTSPPVPPSASTGVASGVTQTAATISGSADTHGLPGTLSFEVGLSPEGGSLEPASVSGSQTGTAVEVVFSFGPYLQPGTTYYYRTVATNADGSAEGEWRSFTTGTFPSPFPAIAPSFPLLTIPPEPKHPATTGGVGSSKPLTNKQKLEKALASCHKDKKKATRKSCERQSRKSYAPATKRTK